MRILLVSVPLLLAMACGGSASRAPEEPESAPVASGGESEPAAPIVLRTTTPVPVPQPAVPRESLSEPLQQLWTRTEEIVADRPPEPPAEASEEAITAWAADPFAPWVERRRRAIEETEPLVAAIGEDPIERPLSAAFFGYMYEDTAAGIRGAPVPEALAHDAELLDVYVQTLDGALRPFAQRALESYAYCATVLARQGGESPWVEWTRYCLERGHEVGEVFGLGGDTEAATSDE
jgi:hypothetical protein